MCMCMHEYVCMCIYALKICKQLYINFIHTHSWDERLVQRIVQGNTGLV